MCCAGRHYPCRRQDCIFKCSVWLPSEGFLPLKVARPQHTCNKMKEVFLNVTTSQNHTQKKADSHIQSTDIAPVCHHLPVTAADHIRDSTCSPAAVTGPLWTGHLSKTHRNLKPGCHSRNSKKPAQMMLGEFSDGSELPLFNSHAPFLTGYSLSHLCVCRAPEKPPTH